MKSKFTVLLLLGLLVFSCPLNAQLNCGFVNFRGDTLKCDIRTPNGSPVMTWAMLESSLETRQRLDNDFAELFPYAVQIITYDGRSSTRRFNCHGHTWLRVYGGANRWIGYDWTDMGRYPDIFMTDGSYIQVATETYPGKVFWGRPGDHSAITTSQRGIFISKWNEGPLMKHAWNDSPFGTDNLMFFVRNTPQWPAHCDNCIQDGDETGLDCGGSCPPCEDAPDNRMVVQDNLGIESKALISLSTSGPLVLSGNTAFTFLAGDEIVLNSGFEITSGTAFVARTSQNRSELTRNFRKVCVFVPNVFTPNNDGHNDFFGVNGAGIIHISAKIADRNGRTVRSYATDVSKDGFITLWDGRNTNGTNSPTGAYFYEIVITTYQGNSRRYTGWVNLFR